MSHFTVVVFGPDAENQLAPFQENNMGDCPEKYLAFNDIEDEAAEEYKGSDREGTPLSTRYPTFEQFMSEWHGMEARNEDKQRYGYWENPQAKWDWYVLGGRWADFFRLKNGQYGISALKRDIDTASMEQEALEAATTKADAVYTATAGIEMPEWKSWDEVIEKFGIEQGRDIYHNHPWIVAAKAVDFWSVEDFLVGREQYIADRVDGAFAPFAVLHSGKWVERGEMGWWATVSNEMDKKTWNQQYRNMWESIPDDTVVSVYDCHI